MKPLLKTATFQNGEAQFGGPPGGFVWSVQVNVPTAENSDTFQLYLGNEQLTSAQGTGLMGPVQVWSGQTVSVKSTSVSPGNKAVLYGQIDAEGKQPSGIFPAISGGVVTTTATYPLSTPQSGTLESVVAISDVATVIFTTPSLPAGDWIVTAAVTIGGLNSTGSADITLVAGTASATFTGQQSATGPAGANGYITLCLVCFVTVTAAGTLGIVVHANETSAEAYPTTYVGDYQGASGWTATRVG